MRVYTSVLRIRRELYQVGDYVLPRSGPMVPLAVFAVVFMASVLVTHILGIAPPPQWWPVFLAPSCAGFWLANRPEIEGRPIWWFVLALLRWPLRMRLMVLDVEWRRRPRQRA